MSRLNPDKLHVQFVADATPEGPITPRRYTLTHSDATGDLFLTIGPDYDHQQTSGWYTRLMRDEVLAEWREEKDGPALHVHCHVSGGIVFGSSGWRDAIFQQELPLALEALRFGDRRLFEAQPELDQSPIWVHFHARQPRYKRVESWGVPGVRIPQWWPETRGETMKTSKFRELAEEFRLVFSGRSNLVDSIIPPVTFLIVNALLGFQVAVWGSLAVALLITMFRLSKRQPLRYAFGGIGGVVIAIVIAQLLGRAEGYFLPGMVTGGLTVIGCLLSVIAARPLVAWTSYIARRWPLDWYWHTQVRPAYDEVTLAWAVFFAIRLGLQWSLFQEQAAGLLGAIQIITGWPATIVLLVASYLYGTWRLRHLRGPSVEEFKAGAEPPWTGQRRGF